MRLENNFRVSLPVHEAWNLLTDLPQVAGCLPGAHLDQVVDGEYRGGLAARIGPINARYQGTASFLEYDEVAHKAVVMARGREQKGSGSASATITLALKPESDDGTNVQVLTDLAITGRAAQFGRSLLAEVSTSMIDEFARRLETMTGAGALGGPNGSSSSASAPPGASSAGPTRPTHQTAHSDLPAGAEPLELGRAIVVPLLRKAAVPLAAACFGALVGALARGPRRRSRPTQTGLPPLPSTVPSDVSRLVFVCYPMPRDEQRAQ